MAKKQIAPASAPAAPTGATYLGRGDYFVGIPARDLTADEWAAIPADTRARLIELGLYAVAGGALPALEVTNAD